MSGRHVARKLIVFMASSRRSHQKQKHNKAKEQHGMLSDTRVRLISTRAAYISSARCAPVPMRACVRVRPSIHAVSVIASPFKNVIIKLTRRPVAYGYLEHEHCRNDELFFFVT